MRPCWFDPEQQMASQAKWHPPHPTPHAPCRQGIGRRAHASPQNTKQQVHLNPDGGRWPTKVNLIGYCYLVPPSCCCPCLPTRPRLALSKPTCVVWPKPWFEAMLLWHTPLNFDTAQRCQLWSHVIHLDKAERVSKDLLCSVFAQTSSAQIHCPSCHPNPVPSSRPSPRCRQRSKASWFEKD